VKIKESRNTDLETLFVKPTYESLGSPEKYLEYRLFGLFLWKIPGQWMSHQIDTVHWFNRIKSSQKCCSEWWNFYLWKDGRKNYRHQ